MTKKYHYIFILIMCFFVSFLFAPKVSACSYGANPCNSVIPIGTHEITSYITGSTLYLSGSVLGHYVCGSNYYYGYGIYQLDGTWITQNTSGCTSSNPYSVNLPATTGDLYVQLWDSNCSYGGCPNSQGYYLYYNNTGGVYTITGLTTNGACGTANGESYKTLPNDLPQLCSGGDAGNIVFNITNWTWQCISNNGGTTADCSANYSATAEAISGVCGSDNGATLNNTTPTNLCSAGTADEVFYVHTGWNWKCLGTDGGADARCSATNSAYSPPVLPPTASCSGLSGVEAWLCGIQNTMAGIFLPSESATSALQGAIDGIKLRAPFCYIQAMSDNMEQLQKGKATSAGIVFTSAGKSGTISMATFGPTGAVHDLMVLVRGIASFFVILIFIFWGISFMRRIFK